MNSFNAHSGLQSTVNSKHALLMRMLIWDSIPFSFLPISPQAYIYRACTQRVTISDQQMYERQSLVAWWHCPHLINSQLTQPVLGSVSVFMAHSTVFHSINPPDNSAFSLCSSSLTSALLVLSTIYISLCESFPQPWYNPLWLTGLKALTNYLTKRAYTRMQNLLDRKCFG